MSVTVKQIQFTEDKDVVAIWKDIAKGCSFAVLEGTTRIQLLAKKRGTKKAEEMTPDKVFKSQDIFRTASRNVSVGASYKVAIENALSKEAGEKVEYEPEALPYGEWVDGLKKYVLDCDSGFQIRYYPDMNKNRTEYTTHYGDGTLLTDAELALLPDYDKNGIKKPHEPQPTRNIKIAGLTRIKAFNVELVRA